MRKRRSDLIDITGAKINLWTVLEYDKCINRQTYWICVCECGTKRSVRRDSLRKYKSCGCLKNEKLKVRSTKHGMYKTILYKRWVAIKQRCYNPKNSRYNRYGSLGVYMCDEWKNFINFYTWAVNNGYTDALTIDRIDNKGPYSPENCRFISNNVQQLNKSNSRIITIENISKTVKEWCEQYGINRNTFTWRINNGWEGKSLLKS